MSIFSFLMRKQGVAGRVKRNKVVIHRTGIGQIMCIYDSCPEFMQLSPDKELDTSVVKNLPHTCS